MCEDCENISSALASLSIETHDMANINIIDPEGDVILICGDTEFQVSSKVLSLASPVFQAFFSPRFAEGQHTSSKANRIQLFDDDAESMRFMCAVLHHKCASANGVGLERLERLAVVTDKYDVRMFSRSVRPDRHDDLVANLFWEWWEQEAHANPFEMCYSAGQRQHEHMLTRKTSLVCTRHVLLGQMRDI